MHLTVVGCAAAWGRGIDAASSCYLVEEGDTAVALDLGQGSFARLATIRAPESLAAVAISHAHPDHCVDLIPLRHYLRYDAATPAGTVALHGPAELPARFDAFVGEPGFLTDLPFSALEPGEFRVGALRVTARRIPHTANSFAFRISAADAPRGGRLLRRLRRRCRARVVAAARGYAPGRGDLRAGPCPAERPAS